MKKLVLPPQQESKEIIIEEIETSQSYKEGLKIQPFEQSLTEIDKLNKYSDPAPKQSFAFQYFLT